MLDQSLQTALRATPNESVEYYAEYLESDRFSEESQFSVMHDYVRRKYSGRKIDVVIATSHPLLKFLLKYRRDLFPNTPIIFLASKRRALSKRAAGLGITGVVFSDAYQSTLALALTLHPTTEQAFIVSGTPERDKSLETEAREELKGFESRVALTYLTDLPLHELTAKLSGAPERSIIFYIRQAQDEPARDLASRDFLTLMTQSASIPVYGISNAYLGYGVVGGYVFNPNATGTKLAEIALRVANGTRPQDIPVIEAPNIPIFDYRQLRRWGISEGRLPAGSDVRFRELSFWDQYKQYIVGAIALILLQSTLITLLLVERHRRQRAREALDERLRFETMLSDLSADFTGLQPEEVDSEIEEWLKHLVEFLKVDRGSLLHFSDGGESLIRTYSYSAPGIKPAQDVVSDERWRDYIKRLGQGTTLNLHQTSEALPKGAAGEREYIHRVGVKSHLALPIIFGNFVVCALTFSAMKSYRRWPDDLIARLRVVGEIFAQALVRKQAQNALRESQQRYALATSAGGVGVWDWNLETNEIYVDPHLKAILGFQDHEIKNHIDDWGRRVHPKDAELVMAQAKAHIEGATPYYEVEHRMLHKDGSIRWFLARGAILNRVRGKAMQMIGTDTDITERKRTEEALRESRNRIEDLAGRLIVAQEDERKHIARELHDDLNQQVATLAIGLGLLERQLTSADNSVHNQLMLLVNRTTKLAEKVRRLSHELHSSTLEHVGLAESLKLYCSEFTDNQGIAVTFENQDGADTIPPDVALCLYRVAQESLRNVAKHSGARHAEVILVATGSAIELRVADHGVGFDPTQAQERRGLGLVSIEERVRLLRGNFTLRSVPGAGTELRVQIPLEKDQ